MNRVCLQTTESSCGPACAATLLRQLGKPAMEREIARECFTSRSGTENWYLGRALRRRGVRVRFHLERNAGRTLPFPSIAGVRLSTLGNSGHFITILGRVDGKYIIGDPLEGKLVLSESALEANYTFTGFFMRIEWFSSKPAPARSKAAEYAALQGLRHRSRSTSKIKKSLLPRPDSA